MIRNNKYIAYPIEAVYKENSHVPQNDMYNKQMNIDV